MSAGSLSDRPSVRLKPVRFVGGHAHGKPVPDYWHGAKIVDHAGEKPGTSQRYSAQEFAVEVGDRVYVARLFVLDKANFNDLAAAGEDMVREMARQQ